MKKLFAIVVAILLLMINASAEQPDLSNYTYDELVVLNRNIIAEIMSRPEWKEVKVPAGTWTIGEDIPAGSYSIKAGSSFGYVSVYKNGNKDLGYDDFYIISETEPRGKVVLENGWVIEVQTEMIFSPPVSLGF